MRSGHQRPQWLVQSWTHSRGLEKVCLGELSTPQGDSEHLGGAEGPWRGPLNQEWAGGEACGDSSGPVMRRC